MWDTADAHLHKLSFFLFLLWVYLEKEGSFNDMKVTARKTLEERFRCVQLLVYEAGSDLHL